VRPGQGLHGGDRLGPVGRPLLTAGVADIVKVSAYPAAQSSRTTVVGPVRALVVGSHPGYERPRGRVVKYV